MAAAEPTAIAEVPFEVNSAGVTVRGAFFTGPGPAPAPGLILLHGIPRAKPAPGDDSYRVMARRFAAQGFAALVFNFRGCGVSDGDLGMAGWTRDLQAVIDFARGLPQVDPKRIALLGFSAGGAVAIRVAAEDPGVAAVVSASSPANFEFLQQVQPAAGWARLFRELGLIRTPGYPASLEAWAAEFDELAPPAWVGRVSPRPLLIVHGEKDELIPEDHARLLFDRALPPKDFILVPGGAHRLRVDATALELIEGWLVRWKSSLLAE